MLLVENDLNDSHGNRSGWHESGVYKGNLNRRSPYVVA